MGAKWICQQMGVDEDDFFQAISCFKGASNRLEKVYSKNNSILFIFLESKVFFEK